MKKLLPILAVVFLYGCSEIKENPQEEETGFLSLGIGIDIEQESASGRLENVVNTDDFLIEIYTQAGALQTSFDPFSSAPAQIELPTGTYYVTASSNNLVDAAFDNPYYFGQSDNFTIDKEENKSVDVVVSLANTKVKVNYSQNVLDNFTRYFGSVTVVSSNVTLDYNQGELRPGYFVSGGDLQVNVTLEYDKAFESNTVISRSLTATIPAALPKTQYNINVDAALVDGQIAINIIVDDSFDEIDIELSNNSSTFNKNYGGTGGDIGLDIKQTSDGGYIAVGYTSSSNGDVTSNNGANDIWVLKIDSNGEIEWQRSLGGSGDDQGYAITETTSGEFVVAGYTNSNDGDIGQNTGSYDMWVVKLNPSGDLLWETTLGGSGNDYGRDLISTSDGGVIAVGQTNSTDGDASGNQNLSGWVIKLNSSGDLVWQRPVGGTSGEDIESVTSVGDRVFFAGWTTSFNGDIPSNNGAHEYMVGEIDQQGNLIWLETYGGSGSEFGRGIDCNELGCIVTGLATSVDGDLTQNQGNFDSWTVSIDLNGSINWQFSTGGSAEDRTEDVAIAPDGSCVLVGFARSSDGDLAPDGPFYYWVFGLDSSGSFLWQKKFSSANASFDKAEAVVPTQDGGFVINGNLFLDNSYAMTVIKVDSQGNL